jgi:hypothetical protein
MYVFMIVLMFGTGKSIEYKVPPQFPVFFSREACENVQDALADALKKDTGAKTVVYRCVNAIPVNAPPA